MSLIGLLIVLLIAAVVLWAARAIIAAFAVPQPIGTVIYVLIVLVVLIYIINSLGVHTGLSHL